MGHRNRFPAPCDLLDEDEESGEWSRERYNELKGRLKLSCYEHWLERCEEPLLQVMVTSKEKNGCSRRLGLGQVEIAQWIKAQPMLKHTILE